MKTSEIMTSKKNVHSHGSLPPIPPPWGTLFIELTHPLHYLPANALPQRICRWGSLVTQESRALVMG